MATATATAPRRAGLLDPHFAVRELQRGINHYHARYEWLQWPHVPVDGNYGPITDRMSRGAQQALGIAQEQIGHWPIQALIGGKVLLNGQLVDFKDGWLQDPELYWERHPGGVTRHNNFKHRYLANIAAREHAIKTGAHGLKVFDGFLTAPRVADHLQWFRDHGWQGQIVEQLGACRSAADQIMLRETNNLGQGGIVAPAGTSEHECYRFYINGIFPADLERGAGDITGYYEARQISDRLGSSLQNNVAGDPVHFDFIH